MSGENVNQTEAASIDRLTHRLDGIEKTASSTHDLIVGMVAKFDFYAKQSDEHDSRITVAERAYIDQAGELRNLRDNLMRVEREGATCVETLEKKFEKIIDELKKTHADEIKELKRLHDEEVKDIKSEFDKRASGNWRIATFIPTAISILFIVLTFFWKTSQK